MMTIEKRVPSGTHATERLLLPFEVRCKSRFRSRLESGEEVGLLLERGSVLRAGDLLLADDGRVVQIGRASCRERV